MEIKGKEALKDVIRQPFAWPGGFEKALIADDGGVICHQCARDNYKIMLHSTKGNCRDGWDVQGVFLVDFKEEVICDNCYRNIAY